VIDGDNRRAAAMAAQTTFVLLREALLKIPARRGAEHGGRHGQADAPTCYQVMSFPGAGR